MNKDWYGSLMSAYKTRLETIQKINMIFSRGDSRYADIENEVVVAGFLDNNAISIDERTVPESEDSSKGIKGPQKKLKACARNLLKSEGYTIVRYEKGFAGGIADIIGKNRLGENIIVECGPCNLVKAVSYLERPNTILWILHPDTLYVVKRSENWPHFHSFHLERKRKEIEKIREKIDSL